MPYLKLPVTAAPTVPGHYPFIFGLGKLHILGPGCQPQRAVFAIALALRLWHPEGHTDTPRRLVFNLQREGTLVKSGIVAKCKLTSLNIVKLYKVLGKNAIALTPDL